MDIAALRKAALDLSDECKAAGDERASRLFARAAQSLAETMRQRNMPPPTERVVIDA